MNQDAIWDYFQNEEVASFAGSLARLRFLVRRFRRGARVLNIGVGGGFFEREALARGIDVYSLDPSARTVQKINDELGKCGHAKVGYCQQIPWPNDFFDGVVMSEILEHLSDPVLGQSLKEVHRVLGDGGLLCGTVPARENLHEQVVMCPCCRSRFHRWGHLQSFDRGRIGTLLGRDYDVRTLSERYFVTWRTLNWKGRIGGATRIMLRALGQRGSGMTIYFCGRKRTAAVADSQRSD